VVFVGSVSALHGRPRHAAYAATKAALHGLTTSLAAELAPRVRVNCVAPGATDTPRRQEVLAARAARAGQDLAWAAAQDAADIPAGRAGTAQEVAAAVAFLASDGAAYVNGTVLTVDGGRTETV
jgi:3-oxoacyl-[acyl-carrier protein] reductase